MLVILSSVGDTKSHHLLPPGQHTRRDLVAMWETGTAVLLHVQGLQNPCFGFSGKTQTGDLG